MGSKGTQTTNTNQTSTYSPTGANYLTNALGTAQNAANLPFNLPQAPVAGLTGQQNQAFGLANNTGIQSPYINQAAQDYSANGAQAFFNPMASAVTSQLNNIFGQQAAQNTGSLTQAAGGVGADRIAIGQGNLANQQGLAAGQTYANLYGQAQQAAQNAGAGQLAAGNQAQGANLADINSLLTTGGLQQQQQQAQLNAPYQQQVEQALFPYQQSQFLTGATGALAPALGGTTQGTGTTTSQYNPSLTSQLLGAGLLGGSLYGAFGKGSGGAVPYASGGATNPFSGIGGGASDQPINIDQVFALPSGGTQTAQAPIPQINLNPQAPNMSGNASGKGSLQSMFKGLQGYDNSTSNLFGMSNSSQDALQDAVEGFSRGGLAAFHKPGPHFKNPFADGGSTPMEDMQWPFGPIGGPSDQAPVDFEGRAAPVQEAIATGDFDPQGINSTAFNAPVPLPKPRPDDAPGSDDDRDLNGNTLAGEHAALVNGSHPLSNAQPGSGADAAPAPDGGAPVSPSGATFASKIRDFERGPFMPLAVAGLGAWTPGGISGGLQAGLKLGQGQQGQDTQAAKLAQEVLQHNDEMTKLNAYQRAQVDLKNKELEGKQDDVIDDKTAAYYGKLYNKTGVMPQIGYGKAASANRTKIAQAAMADATGSGKTAEDIAADRAGYSADKAGMTTAARAGANIDRAVVEAQKLFPLAEQASAAVPRSKWVPINQIDQAFRSGTSDPALAQLKVSNQGVITAYAAAMSRGNAVVSVNAQQHAEDLLNTAASHEAYVAALRQMDKEMERARTAPGEVRQDISDRISGRQRAAPESKPATVYQNGHAYQLQPDGTYQ